MNSPLVLTCGLTQKAGAALGPLLEGCSVRALTDQELVAMIDSPPDPLPSIVFCGDDLKEPGPLEAAQLLRTVLPGAPVYLVLDSLPKLDRRQYIKNGFTDAFALRMDSKLLAQVVAESVGVARGIRAYRPVRLLEIAPGETLPFDTALYLPGNQKYLKLSNAGDPLDAERVARLREHGVRSLHVPLEHMKAYSEHSAARLRQIAATGGPGQQPSEKLTQAVRVLLTGVLTELDREGTFAEGRAVVAQASEIVNQYIKPTGSAPLLERIQALSDEGADAYCHSMNVSTIATLLAIGTGLANPEHLALAGLLHDIGLNQADEDLEAKDPHELSLQERVRLYQHVPDTLELIRKRKILLPTEASRAIAEHHERHDGSGYPDGRSGAKVCIEAQLLGIADSMDRATAAIPGRNFRSIREWVRVQRESLVDRLANREFETNLLTKVLNLFPPDSPGR